MDIAIQQSVDKFSGINTVDSATRLFPIAISRTEQVYPLQQANNVDIDNTYAISSRSGFTTVLTGTDIHSLWSDNVTMLYVDGVIFYKLDTVYNQVIIRSDLFAGARMSYASFNDRIYYTNEHQIGYISKDVDNALMTPAREFKEPLPAGQFIEVHKGCLLVAKDNILYISDPLCDYYDVRTGYRIFNKRITMLRSIVDNGIYVSDDQVWFIKGKGNDEFARDGVFPSPAIPYTDILVAGKYVDDSIDGDVAIWTSENGICLGDNSGKVVNLTEARYTFTARGRGTAFVRDKNNVRHYINSLY
jgi:hypothetical protein